MSDDRRPPTTDADYRLIRGPWPRWAYRMSLISLALWTGGAVVACIGVTLVILAFVLGD